MFSAESEERVDITPEHELPASNTESNIEKFDVVLARDPREVLREAMEAAVALKEIVDKKSKKVMFNGEQYLEFEDWQTVGNFYGITAKVIGTAPLVMGDVRGFEAKAVAIHARTGRELSAAESMCMTDEENWGARPKYEWQYVWKSTGKVKAGEPPKSEMIWEKGDDGKSRSKKEKVQVGMVQVPLFQLRSMAQTRACAKVLRNVLAWVVVLAGYRPTPAEEMTSVHQLEDKSNGKKAEEKKAEGQKAEGKKAIDPETPLSVGQVKHISGLIDKSGISEQDVLSRFNVDDLSKIKFGKINDVIAFISDPDGGRTDE